MELFSEANDIHIGKVAVADGTSEVQTAIEDMAGYDEITFLVLLGDVDTAAVLTFQVEENTASSVSSPAPTDIDIDGGSVSGAVTAVITTGGSVLTEASGNLDNKLVVVNVARNLITKRYVFLSITATVESFEIVSIITIKSRPRNKKITQSTDVASLTIAAS